MPHFYQVYFQYFVNKQQLKTTSQQDLAGAGSTAIPIILRRALRSPVNRNRYLMR